MENTTYTSKDALASMYLQYMYASFFVPATTSSVQQSTFWSFSHFATCAERAANAAALVGEWAMLGLFGTGAANLHVT